MEQEIAKIAYELFLRRGGAPGDPVADWTTAERIYAERKAQEARTISENAVSIAETQPISQRARKAAMKKAETKMESAKAEKVADKVVEKKEASAPRTRKVVRKKSVE